ncbi:MAG: hypothetical protein AAFR41_11455 [Pseudomonadota bacterium]
MSDIGMILDRVGRKMVTGVAPHLEGHYAAGHATMGGLLAIMAGESWDGAADRLHREIEGLRALLEAGGEPADEVAESLKLSDMAAVRNALAARLIALQTRLEGSSAAADKALNTKIWGFLLAGAADRMPSPPEFPDAA